MIFRFHRGGFQESMDTLKEVHSMDELRTYIETVFEQPRYSGIRFSPYGFDEREGWGDTWLVMVRDNVEEYEFPVGMSDADHFN